MPLCDSNRVILLNGIILLRLLGFEQDPTLKSFFLTRFSMVGVGAIRRLCFGRWDLRDSGKPASFLFGKGAALHPSCDGVDSQVVQSSGWNVDGSVLQNPCSIMAARNGLGTHILGDISPAACFCVT